MEVLNKLKKLEANLKKYNPEQRLKELLNQKTVQQKIIDIIQDRIIRRGLLADGGKLITDAGRFSGTGSYSLSNSKVNQGHVDLFETGEFFNEWNLRVYDKVSYIFADKINEIYENFTDSFANASEMMDELGTLSKEEIEYVSKKVILPYLEKDLKEIINVSL